MGKSTFLMEAHDKRAQRGSVSQRAVGPQQPQQDSAPGGGPRRWRTRAPASKSTCTATHGYLCCAMSDARWPDEPRAQPTERTNRRSRNLFFELTARVCETRVELLIQVAATCWKAATPGSLCLVHSVVLCCIPMNRRATPSD